MGNFSLRDAHKQPAPPQQELKLRNLPGFGTVPFRPGETLLPSETKDLTPLGWKPGDPVPPGFAKLLAEVREEVATDMSQRVFKDSAGNAMKIPSLRMPKEIPVEQLPPEKQEQLARQLREYKTLSPQLTQLQQDTVAFESLDPSIQRAIAAANQPPTAEAPDSRNNPASLRPATPQAGIEILKTRTKAEVEAPVADTPKPDAGFQEPVDKAEGQCPHCLGALTVKPPEPDRVDLLNFVTAIMGQQRFLKEYSLLGGKLRAVFRAPSTRDSFLVSEQISRDGRDGKIANLDDMMRLGFAYRLAVSLDSVFAANFGLPVREGVDDILNDPPQEIRDRGDATPLPYIVEKLQEKAPLNSEAVWGILADTTRVFTETLDVIRKRAANANFWVAIED